MKSNNHESIRNIVKFIEGMCLQICFTAIFAGIWFEKFNRMMLRSYENKGNLLIVAVYTIILFMFLYTLGGYKIGVYKRGSVALSQGIALVCTNSVTFLILVLMIGDLHRIGIMIRYTFEYTLLQIAVSIVLIIIETAVFRKLYPPKKMVVLYEKKSADHIIKKIQTREDKYIISDTILVDKHWEKNLVSLSGEFDAVLLYDISSEYRNDILKKCYDREIPAYIVPKISDILVRTADEIQIFDTPLVVSKNFGLSAEQIVLKRLIDITLALIAIIVTSPIILITALLIKTDDGGPVFYKQARCTTNNKIFYIIKFRSMITDAEKDGVARLATENDDRITKIGHFIRKTRIDELPQFFNILKGDMSFVGPRPERPEIIEEYCKEFPEFSFRTKVKAGLTGYAQVYGKYNTTSYDKLKWDLLYIQKYSVGLDLMLIVMTLKIIFMKESTEGLEDGESIAKSSEKEVR